MTMALSQQGASIGKNASLATTVVASLAEGELQCHHTVPAFATAEHRHKVIISLPNQALRLSSGVVVRASSTRDGCGHTLGAEVAWGASVQGY